jgi:aryl-alcohol dehydrogenase
MEITAAVLREKDAPYSLETVQLAEPGPGELLVRIEAVGMCHTDMLPRAPELPLPLPLIGGHEAAGVVEAVGDSVTAAAVGDHVVVSFDSCGTCAACAAGQPAYCETFMIRNLFGRRLDGSTGVTDASGADVSSRWFGQSSFATHALATERNVVVVDPSLPLDVLAPLACGIQTGAGSILSALDVQAGSAVVVYGAGAVGLAAVMAAKVAEAATIIAVDLHQHRLDLASELGATHVVDGSASDVVGQVLAATDGGAGYALDTTGVPSVILGALQALRMTGKLAMVGAQQGDLVLDGSALLGKTVMGVFEGSVVPQDFIPRMISLWQDGRFPFDRLVETFPLSQINEAEQASVSGKVIKPVLLPSR